MVEAVSSSRNSECDYTDMYGIFGTFESYDVGSFYVLFIFEE